MPEEPVDDEALPRYDRLADGYARHWGPVIRPAAVALFDRLDPEFAPRSIVDIGAGTGSLALAALGRWPDTTVAALDSSSAMLELAERDALALGDGAIERLSFHPGSADRMPFADDAFDLAVSSFVLQLVPSRAAALREARRVLRPGGRLVWASWLVGAGRFGADRVVDDVLAEFGFDPPEPDAGGDGGDIASVAAAVAQTRRAGFGDVHGDARDLEHTWSPEAFLGMLTEFDEESLFADLQPRERRQIERRLLEELGRLSTDDLTIRLPVVYVTGVAR